MTKKTPKPTLAHMQKLADLMDTRPEGVTVQRVQDTLQVSPTLAKVALIEIGATEVDGKWVFAEVEQSGNAGELEPEPVTIAERNASLNAVLMPSTQGIGHLSVYGADIDWIKAPEGATHGTEKPQQFIRIPSAWGRPFDYWTGEKWQPTNRMGLPKGLIPRPTSTATPEPKKLTQAVFDGLPSEYRWAAVYPDGLAIACTVDMDNAVDKKLYDLGHVWWKIGIGSTHDLGMGWDASDWQNSKIERLSDTCIEDIGIANFQKECQRVADQQAKSDFAVALEAERQRVLDAVAIGGTVERLAELTELHVDDVQMHLDVLIDDGAIFREPIIIGYGYKVTV